MTFLCVSQNRFQINNVFLKQHEETAISINSYQENHYFFLVWLRYVDDVFLIFDTKKCNIGKFYEDYKVGILKQFCLTLSGFLGNPKDKVDKRNKSGIYQIHCSSCNFKHIDQTRRSAGVRLKK